MSHLISYRPGVIGNNTAFESMALIYKYLQEHYGYNFTILKSSTDNYSDPDFRIINISPKEWRVRGLGLLPPILMAKQTTLNAVLSEADGVLTVDPTIYGQGLLAIRTASLLNKPIWFDTSLTNLNCSQTIDWRLKRKFLFRFAIKNTTGIIATVPKCLERFQDLGLLDESTASKFHIMGHPVDVAQFMPDTKLSKTDGILRVLVVSRMVPEKGILYILEAMTPILKMNHCVQLQFLGSGVLRSLLEREVAESGLSKQVVFLEKISHKDLPNILNKVNLFINHALSTASWEEYFGAANLEAMACEIPCILTNSGGISYAIREKDTAIFVDERNIIQLREAITNLLDNEQECIEIGRRSREYVKDYYDLPIIAEKYHRMVKRGLVENARNRS